MCVCVEGGGEGVQICEGGSKSASGYGPGGSKSASGFGPGGPNPRGVQIRCDNCNEIISTQGTAKIS